MIEFKYKNNTIIGLSDIAFIIGDNYKLREDILMNIASFFETKTTEQVDIKILENESVVNKKDFMYIKLDDELLLDKEYNGDKTTYSRKIIDRLFDEENTENTIIENINNSLKEIIEDNNYIKNISSTLSGDDINLFKIEFSEINRKILVENILSFGYSKANTEYSDKFSKICAIVKILDYYIKCFDIKKRIILVLNEIDNKISFEERILFVKLLKNLTNNKKIQVVIFTKDISFLENIEFDISNITYVGNKILNFTNKDVVIKDIIDIYPGHIDMTEAIHLTKEIFIKYYHFLVVKNIEFISSRNLENMINVLKEFVNN